MQELWDLCGFATACLPNKDINLVVADSIKYCFSGLPHRQIMYFAQICLSAGNLQREYQRFRRQSCRVEGLLAPHLNRGVSSALSFRRF